MSDDIARAVGAGGGSAVTIGGKECSARPLGLRELLEVERDCLERYKRRYLETYKANLDLLPEADRAGLLDRKLDEAGRWDTDDLPPKFAHDPKRIKLTAELKHWLTSHWEVPADSLDARFSQLAAAALDQGLLSEAAYKGLTNGEGPPKVKVPYSSWWITGNFDGMVTLIWTCFRHAGVTREEVLDSLSKEPAAINSLAREIERLSAPQAGNG